MNARRAGRELALLIVSQAKTKQLSKKEIEDITLSTIRTLVNDAQEDLKITTSALIKTKEYIDDYETEHPDNLERPIEASNIPVPIAMTSDMSGRLESLIDVAEKSFQALEIAEIAAIAFDGNIKDFINDIVQNYCKNNEVIDDKIKQYAKGWDIDRLVKIDKNILRLSIAELLFTKDISEKITIDEAVELAKKYSTEESSKFINGILGQIVKAENIKK